MDRQSSLFVRNQMNEYMMNKYKVEVYLHGVISWRINGILNKANGPAIKYINGSVCWYLNGKIHREGGPAVEFNDGHKEWYIHDKRHRADGPAVEQADGCNRWFLNGKSVTEYEYSKRTDE